MHCSTSLTQLPLLPRLPRGLVSILMLSLLLHTLPQLTFQSVGILPSFTITADRWRPLGPRARRRRYTRHSPSVWRLMGRMLPRLFVRMTLLAILLHASGWATTSALTWSVLAMPVVQTLLTVEVLKHPTSARLQCSQPWRSRLQRVYQALFVLLIFSTLIQGLSHLHAMPGGLFSLVGLSVSALSPDHAAEIEIERDTPTRYHVTLRGAFQLAWEPHDSFEKWMLILFLRRLQRVGETRLFLRQQHLTEAFEVVSPTISYWTREVDTYGWHILSDRYRHQIHSALPDEELSRVILKTWVPAFWLSAWDVRERLIQARVIPDRDALTVEALHTLAQHTGFAQVRELLLERFNLQQAHLIARDTWWLRELLALNERLIAKLERGERFTPQELVEIEPLRLKISEKPGNSEPLPLAAYLKSVLFDALPATEPSPTPVRCTYCGSERVAPKSKQPRRKTVFDEFGEKHVIDVRRYYCQNPDCAYHTFTHFPPGVVPHSSYPVHVRLLAVEVYETLLSTYRRSARMFEVTAATLYHWVISLSPAAGCLAAYLGVVRTSGVVGVDDKWILVCSPSAVRPHGRRARAVWRYAYFAVDVYSYDLLALKLYPEHNDEAARLILLELKAKGIRPCVVVTDLDPAYGRVLPKVFPSAIHHECIFHALQQSFTHLAQVYGPHYLEKVPESVPLHEAIAQLFNAQTQKTVRKRFADLLVMRETYVTQTPAIACVFDSLERHFPKLVNAIESPLIPRTNNATELVIRRFDQHYQAMCGLDTLESATIYLRVFEVVYRLTPFATDGRPAIRGKSPLELAGYDLQALPIANFFSHLKLPPLSLQEAEVVPVT
jgi:transposase-like protein